MIFSMLSTTIMLNGLLYESLKTLFRYAILACSFMPTMVSGAMSLIKGNSDCIAIVAASAVFPEPAGPWSSAVTNDVRSLVRTCSTRRRPSRRMASMCGAKCIMPLRTTCCSSSSATPNAGLTSSNAHRKSSRFTRMLATSSEMPAMVPTLTCRLNANDVALLTRPAISAPEKFFVSAASSDSWTSSSITPLERILDVWILIICRRPCSSGKLISMCTSRRPGRSSASSSISRRFVIPIISILFSWSTPSIFDSSWFTTVSPTPVPPPVDPR